MPEYEDKIKNNSCQLNIPLLFGGEGNHHEESQTNARFHTQSLNFKEHRWQFSLTTSVT